jgi:opacity protein-like surface antigen
MSTIRPITVTRLLLTAVLATLAASPLAAGAAAAPPPPTVPGDIQVAAGNKVFLVGHAGGVQIYRCSATASGFAWSLVAPRADLYDDKGKLVATHYGGPTWEAKDGSTVVGRRVAGVTVDPTAIPWLLIERASSAAGPDGGRLAGTTYIQRIATTGGLPPAAASCDATTAGGVVEVAYTGDYHFWKARGD